MHGQTRSGSTHGLSRRAGGHRMRLGGSLRLRQPWRGIARFVRVTPRVSLDAGCCALQPPAYCSPYTLYRISCCSEVVSPTHCANWAVLSRTAYRRSCLGLPPSRSDPLSYTLCSFRRACREIRVRSPLGCTHGAATIELYGTLRSRMLTFGWTTLGLATIGYWQVAGPASLSIFGREFSPLRGPWTR